MHLALGDRTFASGEVGSLARPVSRHHDTDLLSGDTAFAGFSAALACRPVQMACAFFRFKQERFIGFRDPGQMFWRRVPVGSIFDLNGERTFND